MSSDQPIRAAGRVPPSRRPPAGQSRSTVTGRTGGSRPGPGTRSPGPARRPVPATARRRPPRRGRLRLGRIDGRLSVAVIVLLIVMSLFAVRLFQLQVLDSSAYSTAALADLERTVTLPASRGEITDDNGVPLATTVAAYDITADPTVSAPYAARLAAVLAAPLGLTVPALTAQLTPHHGLRYVVLARQVSPAKRTQINDLVGALAEQVSAANSGAPEVGGIYANPDPKRVYPAGNVAGNVLGFVTTDQTAKIKGLAGLERSQDATLAGRNGSSTYEVAYGHIIPSGINQTTPAVQGQSVKLTLDSSLQYYAQAQVAAAVASTGAKSGMAIVMDIKTMQVKAMVAVPTVDPNDPGGVAAAQRGNNAVQLMYEPGSVEKLLTMASLFNEGLATPRTPVTVPTQLIIDGRTIHDDSPHGVEHLTAAGVVAESSNMGAALLGSRLPAATLERYLRSFGYGAPTGIGLLDEQAGLLKPASQWSALDHAEISYGQAVSVTALQMAAAVSSLYNGGVYRAPTLIAGTTDGNGVYHPAQAPAAHRVVSTKAAAEVINEMEMVTQPLGTGYPGADIGGYVVGGKTGTAQYADPAHGGRYHGYMTSFIGVAPADNPQYLVYVVIQQPKTGQTGSSTALPAWRQIMTYLLTTEHLSPTGRKPANLPLTTSSGG